ncbi:MAG: capsid protein [Stenotrophomonas sp.]|nr:MAG: capsid protein [Stenotrophomonas sp.]
MDFLSIYSSVRPAVAALALLGAAAIYAQLRFCLWAAPKVANFFVGRYVRARL